MGRIWWCLVLKDLFAFYNVRRSQVCGDGTETRQTEKLSGWWGKAFHGMLWCCVYCCFRKCHRGGYSRNTEAPEF